MGGITKFLGYRSLIVYCEGGHSKYVLSECLHLMTRGVLTALLSCSKGSATCRLCPNRQSLYLSKRDPEHNAPLVDCRAHKRLSSGYKRVPTVRQN